MAHVFISYKREDRAFVSLLEEKIKEAGMDTWTDAEINAGENWRTRIDGAIREAFVLIVVITPESKKSEYVTYEWSFGMGLGVPILPIILKKVEKLHPKLEELHYFDFTRPYEEPWADLIKQILNWYEKQVQFKIPDDAPIWAREAFMALGHWNPAERELALRALGRKKYLPALPAIIELFRNDADEGVRKHAINAFGFLGSPDAIMPILETIDHEDRLYDNAIKVVYELSKDIILPPEAFKHLLKYLTYGGVYGYGFGGLPESQILYLIGKMESVEAKDFMNKRNEANEVKHKEQEELRQYMAEALKKRKPSTKKQEKSNNKTDSKL